jgi:hypothetical protein
MHPDARHAEVINRIHKMCGMSVRFDILFPPDYNSAFSGFSTGDVIIPFERGQVKKRV